MLRRFSVSGGPTRELLGNRQNVTNAFAHPRKYARYRLEVPVIFSWEDAQETRREQVGLTRDLSIGGAFVFALSPPPLGASIKLRVFPAPSGQALPVRMFGNGQVVRVEPAPDYPHAGFAIAGGRIVFRKRMEH
jgi:hypothetical protein